MVHADIFDIFRKVALAGIALVLTLTLTACGQSASESAGSSPSSLPTEASVQASASSSAKSVNDGITGFGATVGAWNAHHTADTKYDPGSVYDPDPSLPSTGGAQADYIAVEPQDGRVTDYTINTFRLPINAAIARARQELPPDAHELWKARRDTCYQVELTSSTLDRAFSSSNIGDPQGEVLVEFSTVLPNGSSIYRSNDINNILMSIGGYPTAASGSGC
jgi:hypothetical protein